MTKEQEEQLLDDPAAARGYGSPDKLRVGEEVVAAMAALEIKDYLTAAYHFDQAKVAVLILGSFDPERMSKMSA